MPATLTMWSMWSATSRYVPRDSFAPFGFEPGFHRLGALGPVGVPGSHLFHDLAHLPAGLGDDEPRVEVDHDHAAVLLHGLEDIVGDVAG